MNDRDDDENNLEMPQRSDLAKRLWVEEQQAMAKTGAGLNAFHNIKHWSSRSKRMYEKSKIWNLEKTIDSWRLET